VGILALLITIVFTRIDFLSKLSGMLLIPVAGFLVLELAAFLLAIWVIMPKTIGQFNETRTENIPNIFFFGFFTSFSEDEYLDYLTHRLNGNGSARYHLAKDLYQIGAVLRSKYVLVKYAYSVAILGVILLSASTVIFLIS